MICSWQCKHIWMLTVASDVARIDIVGTLPSLLVAAYG